MIKTKFLFLKYFLVFLSRRVDSFIFGGWVNMRVGVFMICKMEG